MAITRRRRWFWAGGLLVVQGAALLASCSESLGEKDCQALAAALGKAESRCRGGRGGDVGMDETISYAANGNCANITSVRDHEQLRDECIPCLEDPSCYDAAALCDDPDAATLPDTCVGQLQL